MHTHYSILLITNTCALMPTLKVLIYEDNDDLRNSIVTILSWNNAFDIVAALPDAQYIIDDVAQYTPDIILMDIEMPNSNGVTAVAALRNKLWSVPVLIFTVFDDDDNVFNAIQAGANGYILKKNFDLIPAALHDIIQGGAPMTSSIAKKVLSFVPKKNSTYSQLILSLSSREIEILELITKGYSYKMIADILKIATETVRTHIKHVYKKLQVNSATEAIYKYNNSK